MKTTLSCANSQRKPISCGYVESSSAPGIHLASLSFDPGNPQSGGHSTTSFIPKSGGNNYLATHNPLLWEIRVATQFESVSSE